MKKISFMTLLQVILLMPAWQAVRAQNVLNGSNMAEFQLGNIPGVDPSGLTSLYDQLNLSYSWKELSLKMRVEQFYPSIGADRDYIQLSQYRLNYTGKNLRLTVGHFYSTLGRGLLLRTYEIPASIWETRGYRVRYGFYRDVEGIEASYRFNKFQLTAVRGKVLDVSLPPTVDKITERRPDLIEGVELNYSFAGQKLGAIYMRNTHSEVSTGYASAYYDGNFLKNFSFYGEFATRTDSLSRFSASAPESGYAAYGNLSFTHNSLGISFEMKDYTNFSIGTGINDPPSLVKEHPYRLLNRSTHLPDLGHESGYQVEFYYRFANSSFLTLNSSSAKNELSSGRSPVFREFFAEYQFTPGSGKLMSHVYADYATDPLVNEVNRYAGGFTLDIPHGRFNSNIETGLQYIERETLRTDRFTNSYISFTFSGTSKYSASIVTEYTSDPIHIDEGKNYALYPSLNLQYRPDSRNQVFLFLGKRRGGPACNSGVCYDVLDFEGLEVRLTTRL